MPEQLKDIKGVLYIFDWGTLLFFLFLALLLAGLAYFLYKLYKKWRLNRRTDRKDAVPVRPFNELALETLMKIDPV